MEINQEEYEKIKHLLPKQRGNVSIDNVTLLNWPMGVSDKVRAMLNLRGRKIKDLAEHLELTQQSMRNKLNRGSFSAEDLIKISMFLNAELSFKMADNQHIVLDENDLR